MRSDPHRASCSLEQASRRPTTVVLPSSAGRRRPASYRGVVTSEVQVTEVPWLDPAAVALRRAMYEELAALYPDETAAVEAGGGFPVRDARAGRDVLLALVATLDGAPVGCAAVRRRPDLRDPLADLGGERQDATDDVGELRSVFVRPEARGRGVGRALLDRADALARTRGLEALVLETGVRQEAALRLYRAAGWRDVPRFAPHTDDPTSVCLALRLT